MRAFDITYSLTENTEFIFESPAEDIISDLKELGAEDMKQKSGNTVALMVPGAKRHDAIKYLLQKLPGSRYNPSMSGSSLGGIEYKDGKIIVKPAGRQGDKSAGVGNEKVLIDKINEIIAEFGKADVTFKDESGKTLIAKNVVKAEYWGSKTANRAKADAVLWQKEGEKGIPVSLKQINAEAWESADSYYGAKAKEIISKLVEEKKVELIPTGLKNQHGADIMRLSKEIAIEPTEKEIMDVVFGSDILPAGGVIVQTFQEHHFSITGHKIIISADHIINSIKDIPKSHMVYFLLRNDSTRRNPAAGIPGIRIIASMASRVYGKKGNKDTLTIKADDY